MRRSRERSILGEIMRSVSERGVEDPLDYDSDDEPRVPHAARALVGATLCHVDALPPPLRATTECWGEPAASSFSVRGRDYARDKVKVPSGPSIYAAVAADAYTGPARMDHIMRRLRLPEPSDANGGPGRAPVGTPSAGIFPRFFVVNIQVPTYEPRLMSSQRDGPSLSIVLVHELVDHGARIAPHARPLVERFFRNETEETGEPSRERLKYIPRIANLEEVATQTGMSRAEKSFMAQYDAKPVMTKPQHRFYRGPGYLEVCMDSHNYSFITRKGMHAYRAHLDKMVFDCGFVLQGNNAEELPEQVLACTRIYRLDFWRDRGAPPSGAALAAASLTATALALNNGMNLPGIERVGAITAAGAEGEEDCGSAASGDGGGGGGGGGGGEGGDGDGEAGFHTPLGAASASHPGTPRTPVTPFPRAAAEG